ncbi:hypothetical protein DUNSADRAFT_5232 [Dunaliella salina]|uniref:Uncharacterized protein n=1 Tax=Dunaliella salina TaxID=3046 RepID=A0ABQ7GQL8_DUNSA|nr:hypothetical protein DUNSADRAFT_5232 [Dunaliella salina]|eukprot:KAF5836901.1 hypothetical protein DUNSADRAFT_5232 [Dunaliella salina]
MPRGSKSVWLGKRYPDDKLFHDEHIRREGGLLQHHWHKTPVRPPPGHYINCMFVEDKWEDDTNGEVKISGWNNHPDAEITSVQVTIEGYQFRGLDWRVWAWCRPWRR